VIIVKLCYAILPRVRVNMNFSCIKSFAVDKLLAAAAPKPRLGFGAAAASSLSTAKCKRLNVTGQLADAANRSICCFNCMIELCGYNTSA